MRERRRGCWRTIGCWRRGWRRAASPPSRCTSSPWTSTWRGCAALPPPPLPAHAWTSGRLHAHKRSSLHLGTHPLHPVTLASRRTLKPSHVYMCTSRRRAVSLKHCWSQSDRQATEAMTEATGAGAAGVRGAAGEPGAGALPERQQRRLPPVQPERNTPGAHLLLSHRHEPAVPAVQPALTALAPWPCHSRCVAPGGAHQVSPGPQRS